MEKQLVDVILLSNLSLGDKCKVNLLIVYGPIRRRFLDLGLIAGTEVIALEQSPSGDPIAYFIRGAVIALRSEDASQILVEKI